MMNSRGKKKRLQELEEKKQLLDNKTAILVLLRFLDLNAKMFRKDMAYVPMPLMLFNIYLCVYSLISSDNPRTSLL